MGYLRRRESERPVCWGFLTGVFSFSSSFAFFASTSGVVRFRHVTDRVLSYCLGCVSEPRMRIQEFSTSHVELALPPSCHVWFSRRSGSMNWMPNAQFFSWFFSVALSCIPCPPTILLGRPRKAFVGKESAVRGNVLSSAKTSIAMGEKEKKKGKDVWITVCNNSQQQQSALTLRAPSLPLHPLAQEKMSHARTHG